MWEGVSKALTRVRRGARNVPHGTEILEFLSSPKVRKALVEAAEQGEPPVAAISREFANVAGPRDVKLAQVKQFAGRCITAILEEEGYEIERSRVWLGNDPVFSTGSVYRKGVRQVGDRQSSFFERFVRVLNEDEAAILQDLLRRRLGKK